MPSPLDRLAALDRGFRTRYLDHEALTAQVRAWSEAFPDLCRLRSLGETLEGRPLWHLTIGPDPDRIRPAVWVDGNMHASELAGSSVALGLAEDALRLHLAGDDDGAALHHLGPHLRDRLRQVLVYVMPRMSPDGAECVLKTGRYVRSAPRDRRANRQHARWVTGDIDGDGLALLMRVEDPAGEFVESADVPNMLLPRRLEDPPPYYRLYPEGTIENFDGHQVPEPNFLSDNQTDLNRNFPYSWHHEPEQTGAGAFPGSEPESRAVIEFAHAHPEIFAWLNCHTFGGVFIRPLGEQPDTKMHEEDLAVFREIAAWSEELTGYPMVSGFEEFLYEPDRPLYGDLSEFAFHQRGAIAYVVELWDLFRQIGMKRPKRFVDYYTHMTRADLVNLGKWDREHNRGRGFIPWRPARHPQLGDVEVGGVDPRFGLWNPPEDRLAEVCAGQSAAFLRVAAMAPALSVSRVAREVRGDVTRVALAVDNTGYLPTYILQAARKLEHNEPLSIDARALGGAELLDPAAARLAVGHLDGWGRGLYGSATLILHGQSRGNKSRAVVTYHVRGHGVLELRIGSCRVGWIDHREEV
ncbi:MAG TPA: M14 family metallopeptidase [Kofleriaceae bacterium]|nr:M14 family metallopeptidase [Kofleriaceae bacterium]